MKFSQQIKHNYAHKERSYVEYDTFSSNRPENRLLKEVEEKGLLLAACPHDTPVRVYSYEYRNKLLATMCEGTLVLGAAKKSGALITAKYAKQYGKKIFALPYSPGVLAGEGCNDLIKQGAYLTESAEDVLQAYGIARVEKPKILLTGNEQTIVEAIAEGGEMHVSELAKATGIPVFKLTTLLSALEIKGVVVKLGGNRYSVV